MQMNLLEIQLPLYLAALGWDDLILLIITIAFTAYSSKRAKDRASQSNKLSKGRPSTSTKGESLRYWIGYHLMPVDLMFPSNRKKGEIYVDGVKTKTYFEDGFIVCQLGPVSRLNKILEGGNVLWEGPITPETHPNGSEITMLTAAGSESLGSFKVYWGNDDQPIDADLVAQMGIDSAWLGVFYLRFKRKRISPDAVWPQIEIETFCEPKYSNLVSSPRWFDNEYSLTGKEYEIVGHSVSANAFFVAGNKTNELFKDDKLVIIGNSYAGTATIDSKNYIELDNTTKLKIVENISIGNDQGSAILNKIYTIVGNNVGDNSLTVSGNKVKEIRPYSKLEISGNDFLGTVTVKDVILLIDNTKLVMSSNTKLVMFEDISIANDEGSAFLYQTLKTANANPAHMLYQFMFATPPHGRGLNINLFDIQSLEEFGVLCEQENLRMGQGTDGDKSFLDICSSISEDAGLAISWDSTIGKYKFISIRARDASKIIVIPKDAINELNVENTVSYILGQGKSSRYKFKDAELGFTENNIKFSEDGDILQNNNKKTKVVFNIDSVNSLSAASKVGNRRDVELVKSNQGIKLRISHGGKFLKVGDYFKFEGEDKSYICTGVRHIFKSPEVEVYCIRNVLGTINSTFEFTFGTIIDQYDPYEPDIAVRLFELPEPDAYVKGGNETRVLPLRIRSNGLVNNKDIWVSTDDVSYIPLANNIASVGGGLLKTSITSKYKLLPYIDIDIQGPDLIESTQNISSNLGSWYGSSINWIIIEEEVLTYQYAQLVSGTTFRFYNVLRGRVGTIPTSAGVDQQVYILRRDSVQYNVFEMSYAPGTVLYLKFIGENAILSEIEPIQYTVVGRGIKPAKPTEILMVEPVKVIDYSGANPTIKLIGDETNFNIAWGQTSRTKSGAGYKPLGDIDTPLCDDLYFIVKIYGMWVTNTLVHSAIVKILPSEFAEGNDRYLHFDFSMANLLSWFGEVVPSNLPDNILIEVYTTRIGGYSSDSTYLQIVKLAV